MRLPPDPDPCRGRHPGRRPSETRSALLGRLARAGLLALGFAIATFLPVRAHDRLKALLSEEVRLEAGATNLDLTLELTFHEVPSFAERRRMDTNRNGRVDPEEVRSYLRDRIPELEDGLELTLLSGTNAPPARLPLTLLHNSELDLRGNPVVGLASHVLRFRLFARTPPGLVPGSRVRVASQLWPHLPATRSVQATGRDGYRLEPEPASPPASPGTPPWAALAGSFRCTAAPARPGPPIPAALGATPVPSLVPPP